MPKFAVWWKCSSIHLVFIITKIIGLCCMYRGSGDMSTRDIQKMVQALPQYSEQVDKLSLHIEVVLL